MLALLTVVVSMVSSRLAAAALLHGPGPIAEPVPDRWHWKSTPVTGGLALFAGFVVALGAVVPEVHADRRFAYLAVGGGTALLLGLADDKRWIGPQAKFAGQIAIAVAAAVVIRPHWLPAAVAVPVAAFVFVGAMNSFNLLDNIDGLAAGTAAIAAAALVAASLVQGGSSIRMPASAVLGTCLGFLPLNYRRNRPAALFMGDSGAHFLGFIVAALALSASPRGASGVSMTVVAPLLILALPILDTSLVILVRLAEGRPIWRGGRDHLSHRLVYVGLGERQAVAALLGLAAVCGGAGILVVAIDDALVTGAAAGAVLALLIGLGSRLVLVAEERRIAILPLLDRARRFGPVRDHAHAR